ncbi:MAG: SDR family NAD(P)-dependent oxidoreductase, partial [Gemmatimonadetes bacterium]|nr:SDR family NAD(P)-dependent oxidoreductase [Gemmatimonadota bacterium]
MELGLGGRVALVCGSTRGLGRAVAKALAKEGARVALNGRHENEVSQAARELTSETGQPVACFVADVAIPDQAEQLVGRTARELGRLDILF